MEAAKDTIYEGITTLLTRIRGVGNRLPDEIKLRDEFFMCAVLSHGTTPICLNETARMREAALTLFECPDERALDCMLALDMHITAWQCMSGTKPSAVLEPMAKAVEAFNILKPIVQRAVDAHNESLVPVGKLKLVYDTGNDEEIVSQWYWHWYVTITPRDDEDK